MFKRLAVSILIIAASLIASSCSDSKMQDFQTNDVSAPFNLFHLFDHYPALKAAWDSVPGGTGNAKMADMLNENIPIGAEFMHILSYLMDRADDPGLGLLGDLRTTLGLVTNTDQRLYGHSSDNTGNPIDSFFATDTPADLMTNFYALLDELTNQVGGDTPKMGASVMGMTNTVANYLTTKTPEEIEDTMGDLMEALTEDVDPADGTKDFADTFASLMDIVAPMMSMVDFPMWIHHGSTPGADYLETDYASMNASDSVNSDLGNAAKGVNYLMSGLFDLINGETIDREFMYSAIDSLNAILADPSTAEKLVWNLVNYFTVGGYQYERVDAVASPSALVDTDIYKTDTASLYSNADMRQSMKEFLGSSGPLFMRDDRRGSFAWKADGTVTSHDYPLTDLLENVKKIYINWDTTQMSESIYDLLRYDMFGRDRRNDTSAYSASILEHLLYLGAIAGNMGWEHLPSANEVNHDAGNDSYEGQMALHGHGQFCGNLTLNDSLYSIQGKRDSLAASGTYELGFDSGNGYRNRGYDRTYRSRKFFPTASRGSYTFNFNVNYPALKFLAGASVGDYGVAAGGNPLGGGGNDSNEYMPYSANGVMTKDLASWTFAHIIRACWEGEGPYYYADPAATTETVTTSTGSFTGTKYLRPDGRVYAYVSGTTYYYPVNGGNDVVDDTDEDTNGVYDFNGQRYNRYKATWHSDFYMIESQHDGSKYYVPIDDGSLQAQETTTGPKYRSYTELIDENYSGRACASQEEAIFRNFQWVMNEKRMALIIPLWLAGEPSVLGCPSSIAQAGIETVLYQIIEGNGITGLSNARKYRSNAVWAKQNNDDDLSTYPGDYRIVVLATPIRSELKTLGIWSYSSLSTVDEEKIYVETLGRGTATPAGVSQNIFALSRFGFPRSKPRTVANTYTHYLLGSKDVDNADTGAVDTGFRNTGAVWSKRNSLMPLFVGLLAPLHARSYYVSESNCNNALARQLEGLNFLLKPMIYFNYNAGSATGHSGVAQNGWLPRIKGDGDWDDEEYEATHSRSLMSDWDVDGFVNSTSSEEAWHGGWVTTTFYTPADLTTLLSAMMDSDTSWNRANRLQRADGLLGKMLEYDANTSTPNEPDRPSVTETPLNWTLTANSETAIARMLAGVEQVALNMKFTKPKGIEILEDQSTSGGTIAATTKQINPPEWNFQKRVRIDDASKVIDLDLDDLLTKVIGDEGDDGINKFQDNDANYANGGTNTVGTWTWTEEDGFEETIDDLYDLSTKFLAENGPNVISEYLFNIIDVMAQHRLTQPQIKGMQYVLGKLLAYYDDESLTHQWVVQGEGSFNFLLDLLTVVLPNIDTEMGLYGDANHADEPGGYSKGRTYLNLMTALRNSTKEGGFVPWIVDEVGISPYTAADFMSDLVLFLDSDLINAPNTKFYSTMAQLLGDMGDQIEVAPTDAGLRMIYEYYGYDGH